MVRRVSRTALIYCEGAEDLAFVRHLISLYGNTRQLKKKLRTRQGGGGSADSVVIGAVRVNGAFDERLVILDSDRADSDLRERDAAQSIAGKHSLEIVWNTPCLEGLLLEIIEGKDYSKNADCKVLFESKYISPEHRTDSRAYSAVLKIEHYENARLGNPRLDTLIRFITD